MGVIVLMPSQPPAPLRSHHGMHAEPESGRRTEKTLHHIYEAFRL